MKYFLAAILVIAILVAPVMAFCPLKYSYVSGFNRICVYDCIDGEVAITVDALDLCPLSLD